MHFPDTVPWFLPSALLFVIVGVAAQRPVARALAVSPAIATALVVSVGLVVAATLTPLRRALESGAAGSGRCDLSRLGLPSLEELTSFGANDIALNVVLLVPLGLAIGLAPRSHRKLLLLGVAVATPVAIEAIQLVVTTLGRGCESADVVDNLLGLALGVTTTTVLRRLQTGNDIAF